MVCSKCQVHGTVWQVKFCCSGVLKWAFVACSIYVTYYYAMRGRNDLAANVFQHFNGVSFIRANHREASDLTRISLTNLTFENKE